MNETHILLTLATVHFLALMSPGPDFALVVYNATRYGKRIGFAVAFGLSLGILTHSILSIAGISLLVQQHPLWFAVIQFGGGSYLVYLGLSALKAVIHQRKAGHHSHPQQERYGKALTNSRLAITRGFLTNILNPKALVFFISLMSSLIPVGMSVNGKVMALIILWALALFWFSLLAWVLSTDNMQKLIRSVSVYIDTLCGLIFTGLGAAILWSSLSHGF